MQFSATPLPLRSAASAAHRVDDPGVYLQCVEHVILFWNHVTKPGAESGSNQKRPVWSRSVLPEAASSSNEERRRRRRHEGGPVIGRSITLSGLYSQLPFYCSTAWLSLVLCNAIHLIAELVAYARVGACVRCSARWSFALEVLMSFITHWGSLVTSMSTVLFPIDYKLCGLFIIVIEYLLPIFSFLGMIQQIYFDRYWGK